MSSLPQAVEKPAIVLRFLHRLVRYETGTSRAQTARYAHTKVSNGVVCLLALSLWAKTVQKRSRRVTMYRFLPDSLSLSPGPKGSIFLMKSILCLRTYNDSIDPSIHIQQSGLSVPSTVLLPTTCPTHILSSHSHRT